MPNTIGRYQIIELLGSGGMASVYRAYDPYVKREVALKVIAAHFMQNNELRERFKQEAKVIAALEHPAIVPVYDFGEDKGQPFLVMRLMKGGSLKNKLIKRRLSLSQIITLLERLAPALDTAHRYGIVHRDIKPDNILFDDANRAYLSDFGVAKLISQTTLGWTQSGSPIGSPPYMSPEQARGLAQIDGRSDIYSLGVLLFELLSGQRPYQADSLAGYVNLHLNAPVPDIRQINARLPQSCQNLILRAMAKEPKDRYRNASELVAELKRMTNKDESKPQNRKPWLPLAALLAGGVGALFILCIVMTLTMAPTILNTISDFADTATPTATVTPSATATPTATPTVTLTPTPAFTPTPSANAHVEKGDALRDEGRHEEAIAPYTDAINLDPNNAEAYFGRAYSHAERGEFDFAIADYTNVIRINPNDAGTYNNRGNAYYAQDQLDLAIADYTEAIRLDPDYAFAYHNRGLAYSDQGQFDLAIADYSEAIRLDPNDFSAYYNRGNAYLNQEELDLAIIDYDQAIRLNPDYALAYNNRGVAYQRKGERDLAIADYRKALELDNDPTATELARENLQSMGVEP